MNKMQLLGNLVRETRERRGMEAQQLAATMGVSKGTVSNIERGVIKTTPDADFLRKLADAVGLTMPQIMRTLGYLDDESGKEEGSLAVRRLQPLIDSVQWNEGTFRLVESTLENLRAMQSGTFREDDGFEEG